MKKILPALLIILMAFSAASFTASLDTVKQDANVTSPAQFQLQVENPSPDNESYSFSVLSPKSSWFYYPNNLRVNANSNGTANITVSPVEKALQQRYRFDVTVLEESSGEVKDLTGFFRVNQPYRLHIVSLKQDRQKVLPGEAVSTEIEIQNLDSTAVSNYEVKAEYRNQVRTDSGTEILPEGTRRYAFSFRTARNATPATHPITYTVTADGQLQNTAEQTITVESVQNMSRTEETEDRILTLEKTVTAENTGNSPTNTSITAEVPSYLSSITTTEPEPDSIEEIAGQTVYTWETRLEPGESFSTGYTTQYWIPLLGTVLLAAGVFAIKMLGRDVVIRKTAEKDGDQIKVNLEIENTGEKTFDRLELEDFIPDIATVDESFSMNTPKIRKTGDGTRLTWNVEKLEPGDQRIIQYRIKPKVDVEEKVKFQRAELKDTEGQTVTQSNTATSEFNTT
jgi:hypothetical protein